MFAESLALLIGMAFIQVSFMPWFGEDRCESSKKGSPVYFCLRKISTLWSTMNDSVKSVPGLSLEKLQHFEDDQSSPTVSSQWGIQGSKETMLICSGKNKK